MSCLQNEMILETITKNPTIDEKTLIKSCGYVTVTKSGKEKILFTSFYKAVLVAKGCTN